MIDALIVTWTFALVEPNYVDNCYFHIFLYQAEAQFLEIQEVRRSKQNEISTIETELRALTAEIEKTHRGEQR